MSNKLLSVVGLCKSFGTNLVLKDVNLSVNKGDRVAVIGSSGSGKSVFLRCIAMLEKPDNGQVLVNDLDITKKGIDINLVRQKMGMVYQGFHLFTQMNVFENIVFAPIKIKKVAKPEAEKKAIELLQMVGLKDKIYAMPDTLSGGQKQRVAIARCLAMEPDLLLLDEPTSALDPSMTAEVLAIIRKLTKTGLTILIVTHEMSFAESFASRVIYIDDFGIYEEGSPQQIFNAPKKQKTIAFIDSLKVFEQQINSTGFDIVGMNAQVGLYFEKYGLQKKRLMYLELLLEELLTLLFREHFAETTPNIKLTIRYAGQKDDMQVTLDYTGTAYDPFNSTEDDLSVMLINKLCRDKVHTFEKNKNSINITLKEEKLI